MAYWGGGKWHTGKEGSGILGRREVAYWGGGKWHTGEEGSGILGRREVAYWGGGGGILAGSYKATSSGDLKHWLNLPSCDCRAPPAVTRDDEGGGGGS